MCYSSTLMEEWKKLIRYKIMLFAVRPLNQKIVIVEREKMIYFALLDFYLCASQRWKFKPGSLHLQPREKYLESYFWIFLQRKDPVLT